MAASRNCLAVKLLELQTLMRGMGALSRVLRGSGLFA